MAPSSHLSSMKSQDSHGVGGKGSGAAKFAPGLVKVDAQVFLRIAKHAKQNFPNSASGSLLGLDDGRSTRVTNSFAYKVRREDEGQNEFLKYQYSMLQAIEEVRGDANAVGWYESTAQGNFLSEALIENQYQFQKEVPTAVVLVYDPAKISFKAFRLTDKAMKQRTNGDGEDEDPFVDFPSKDLLEEVSVYVHCSPLVETLLLQMGNTSSFESAFDVDANLPTMERNLSLLLESLEELSLQQREMHMYERLTKQQRDKQQKNQRVPKTLDTLNLTQQIQTHCAGVNATAKDTFGKLFLLDAKAADEDKLSKVRSVISKLGGA